MGTYTGEAEAVARLVILFTITVKKNIKSTVVGTSGYLFPILQSSLKISI